MSKAEKRNYHHGDLRAALIAAGLQLLTERTADDIGLREVARAVGVSATAVYRHFPDKASLLRALAAEGLAKLAEAQRLAFDQAGGGIAGFDATGRAYVRFALDHPALFRLIFSNPPGGDPLDSDPDDVPEAFRLLRDNAASIAPPGAGPDQVKLVALRAWTSVHGLALLLLDGQIRGGDALIAAMVDSSKSIRATP